MIEAITAEIQIESRAYNSNVITRGDNAGNGDNQRNSNTSIDREVHLMRTRMHLCLVSSVPRRDAIDYWRSDYGN